MVERYKEENRCLKRSKVTKDDSLARAIRWQCLKVTEVTVVFNSWL